MTAPVPPSAHTECARITCTLDTIPIFAVPRVRMLISTAARKPASPVPRISTSWVVSVINSVSFRQQLKSKHQFCQQESDSYRRNGCHHPRKHEAVVQNVLSDTRGAGLIE